jgi:hypothetical protein
LVLCLENASFHFTLTCNELLPLRLGHLLQADGLVKVRSLLRFGSPSSLPRHYGHSTEYPCAYFFHGPCSLSTTAAPLGLHQDRSHLGVIAFKFTSLFIFGLAGSHCHNKATTLCSPCSTIHRNCRLPPPNRRNGRDSCHSTRPENPVPRTNRCNHNMYTNNVCSVAFGLVLYYQHLSLVQILSKTYVRLYEMHETLCTDHTLRLSN